MGNNCLTPRSFSVLRVDLLMRNFDSFPSFLTSLSPAGLAMTSSSLPHEGSGLDVLARFVGGVSSGVVAYV